MNGTSHLQGLPTSSAELMETFIRVLWFVVVVVIVWMIWYKCEPD